MFCALCEEACPTKPKSIWLTTKTYELAKKYGIKTAWGTDVLFSAGLARHAPALEASAGHLEKKSIRLEVMPAGEPLQLEMKGKKVHLSCGRYEANISGIDAEGRGNGLQVEAPGHRDDADACRLPAQCRGRRCGGSVR